jgi:hypothetical protein
MDPTSIPGWKTDQKEFANWSDSETSSISSDEDDIATTLGYYKLLQTKKKYKCILEEEELIS